LKHKVYKNKRKPKKFFSTTFTHVAIPCSERATKRGGIVAMKIPATGMKLVIKVNRLKNPRPDI
jgi:hypothetical protein